MLTIEIVENSISLENVKKLSEETYAPMIKGVVDLVREIIALGGEYHMDANLRLLESGSNQENVWGFNIQTDQDRSEWIEYTSLINIRPQVGNRSMEVLDEEIRAKIKEIINKKIL